MATNYNLHRQLNSPACDAGLSQKFSELLQSLNPIKDQNETEKRKQRISLFGQIFDSDNSYHLQQCGMYILIDQLLTEGENSGNPLQCKNLGSIAKKLLRSCESCQIMISPPEKIDTQQYIDNIIVKAEAAARENSNSSPELRITATELQNRSNELLEFFSKTWGKNIPYRFLSFQKFFSSWQKFAKQLLKERLDALQVG